MAPPISRPRADCRQRGPAQCGQRPGFADRTRRVDLPAAAHGENLPSLCLAAPLRRLIPGRPEADQDPVPEHHSLRHASADSRLSPTPVPGQDLIPVLAGRRRAAGRAPVHVGVKKVAEGRQVGCLQGQSDLLRDAFRSFQLPGHRLRPRRSRILPWPPRRQVHCPSETPPSARCRRARFRNQRKPGRARTTRTPAIDGVGTAHRFGASRLARGVDRAAPGSMVGGHAGDPPIAADLRGPCHRDDRGSGARGFSKPGVPSSRTSWLSSPPTSPPATATGTGTLRHPPRTQSRLAEAGPDIR